MSVTVTVAGQKAFSPPISLDASTPANLSLPVAVTNTPGDWLVAAVTWQEGWPGAGIDISIEDDAHNMWEPLGLPSADSPGAGQALPGTPGPTGTTIFTTDANPPYSSVTAAVQGWNTVTGVASQCMKIYFAAPGSTLINMYPYYNTGYVAGQNPYIDACLALGITPICCYKPPLPYTSADSGHMQASMAVITAQFAVIGITPIWVFWQEVQNLGNGIPAATWLGTGTPGAGGGNTGEPQYYYDVKHSTSTITGPIYYDSAGHAGASGWQAYFPGPPNTGGLYCDGVAVDFYCSAWNNGAITLDAAAALADAHNLPFGLFETGQALNASGVPSRATLQAYFTYLQQFMVSGVPGVPGSGRLAQGKVNGPVLWYDGGGNNQNGNWNTVAPQPNPWGYDTSYIPAMWATLANALAGGSASGGVMRTAWWAAPAALAGNPATGITNVMIAPTGLTVAMAATIFDVGGMAPWMTVAGILSAFTANGTTLSLSLPAPPSQTIMLAALGSNTPADTISGPGAGWTSAPQVNTAGAALNAAWQVTTAAATASWSSNNPQNLAGVTAALLVTGTPPAVQASPDWPAVITECAPGAGIKTPPSGLAWVPLSARSLDLQVTQGTPYLRGQLQAGQGTMTFDDPDGALIPPGSGAYAGIDSGTPVRQRMIWQGGAWQVQFHGNGATAAPGIDSGAVLAAAPGNAYTASAWLACSAPYASGVTLALEFRNAGGSVIGTAVSPAVTGPMPVLAIATGTAPAGTASASILIAAAGTPAATVTFSAAAAPPAPSGYLAAPPGVTWAAQNSATAATLAPWTPDPRGAPNPCPQAVPFSGYLQQLPPTWDPLLRGQTQATVTDAWGYATRQMRPILRSEILTDNPAAYWPLAEPAAAASGADIAPGPSAPLSLVVSKYGSAGAGAAFGGTPASPLIGDGSSPMFLQTLAGTSLASSGYGYCLSAASASFPPISGGITIDCFFQGTFAAAPAFNTHLWTLLDGRGPVLRLALNTSGNLQLTYWNAAGVSTSVNLFGSQTWYNSTGPLYVVITATQSIYQAYIYGATLGPVQGGLSVRPTFNLVNLAGSFNRWVTGGQFSGYLGHVAIYPSVLPQARWGTHLQAGLNALKYTGTAVPAESCSSRVERLLGHAGLPGRRLILPETGPDFTPAASAADIAAAPAVSASGGPVSNGNTAAAAVTAMAASTAPAVLAVTPAGATMYASRQYCWNQPVRWVLGNRPDLGEIPFTPAPAGGYDPARVVNDIAITQEDTQVITTPDVPQAASQAAYGDQTYTVTGYLASDASTKATDGSYGYSATPGASDLADWLANTAGQPSLRGAQVTVECATNPAAWPLWMRAACGDMVTVNWRPPTNPGQVFTVTGRIMQIAPRVLRYSLSGVSGAITFAIDPAPEYNALTCDDPVRGQLTGGNVLAW